MAPATTAQPASTFQPPSPPAEGQLRTASRGTTRVRNRRTGWMWLFTWPGYLVWILTLLVSLVFYWQWCAVSGAEFNSHTWEQRGFSLHRDPLSGTQLTGILHNPPHSVGWNTTAANPHAKKLPAEIRKYLPSQTLLPLRWDLIRLEGSNLPGGAASILADLLEAHDELYQAVWPKWSKDHPQRAAVVWPAAHQLVEFGQYIHLPPLFELALVDNSVSQLTSAVGQLVQQALLEAGLRQFEQKKFAVAKLAAEVGLQYGEHAELRKLVEQANQPSQ